MEEKGSKILKFASIIMIIGGILSALGGILIVAAAGLFTAFSGNAEVQQAVSEAEASVGSVSVLLWVAAIITIVGAVIEIVAGIKGKKNWNNPEAFKTLLILGIACAAMSLISNIILAGEQGIKITSIISGLVIPALYIYGVTELKKQVAAPAAPVAAEAPAAPVVTDADKPETPEE